MVVITIMIDDDTWEEFSKLAKEIGFDRAEDLFPMALKVFIEYCTEKLKKGESCI